MENRKDSFIIKIPFNSSMKANENINIEFDMDHIYMFDKDTHKAIIGIPFEDMIPVSIKDNVANIGKQSLVLSEDCVARLLDSAYAEGIHLGIISSRRTSLPL